MNKDSSAFTANIVIELAEIGSIEKQNLLCPLLQFTLYIGNYLEYFFIANGCQTNTTNMIF